MYPRHQEATRSCPVGPARWPGVRGPAAGVAPYRLKKLLLGPPLISDQLSGQRLGKPTALAVLSSDVMSSSAYATEQILRILIPVGGLAAFALVTPITLLILAVLAVVTICYRDVVKSYPKAGGSYVVSRDNFGPNIAQIAGAALLISYTITVAVSVAAGTDAIISAVPSLGSVAVPLSVAFVVLIAYGNLRGLKEAGKVFAIPTYFFIANMAVLILAGLAKAAAGDLGHVPPAHGQMPFGHEGAGLLLGVSLFYVARAFANGGSAMTGTEAISNGVSVFRDPQAKNARTTLVIMSCILGSMFFGRLGAGRPGPRPAIRVGHADGGVGDRSTGLRAGRRRSHSLRAAAGRDGGDPDPGRQHQLHRIPVPGQLCGRGLVPAPTPDRAGTSAGVLQRDHRPGRGLHRPAAGHRRPGGVVDPDVRHRGVHRLHHGRGRA